MSRDILLLLMVVSWLSLEADIMVKELANEIVFYSRVGER